MVIRRAGGGGNGLGASADAAACEAGGGAADEDACEAASELAACDDAADEASTDEVSDAFEDGASDACEDGASDACEDEASDDGSELAAEDLGSSEASSLGVTMSTLTAGGGLGSPTGSRGSSRIRKIIACTPTEATSVQPMRSRPAMTGAALGSIGARSVIGPGYSSASSALRLWSSHWSSGIGAPSLKENAATPE